jgi:hypothetical protein
MSPTSPEHGCHEANLVQARTSCPGSLPFARATLPGSADAAELWHAPPFVEEIPTVAFPHANPHRSVIEQQRSSVAIAINHFCNLPPDIDLKVSWTAANDAISIGFFVVLSVLVDLRTLTRLQYLYTTIELDDCLVLFGLMRQGFWLLHTRPYCNLMQGILLVALRVASSAWGSALRPQCPSKAAGHRCDGPWYSDDLGRTGQASASSTLA